MTGAVAADAGTIVRRPRVRLVVPCFEEEHRLDPQAFAAALAASADLAFLFVDDGSTDGTLRVLRELAARAPGRCEVLPLARNLGKAGAVRAGLLHALAGPAEYVGYWDADLATPLDALPAFVAVLDARPACMMVLGSRVQLLGRRIERRAARHYLGRVFATTASAAVGLPVYDTQCGAKLLRAAPEVRAVLEPPFISRWAFDVEILARLRVIGGAVEGRLVELPLERWHDVAGTKLSAWSALGAGLDLLRIAWRYRWRRAAPVVARSAAGEPPLRVDDVPPPEPTARL